MSMAEREPRPRQHQGHGETSVHRAQKHGGSRRLR
jgi:hypothetical protein